MGDNPSSYAFPLFAPIKGASTRAESQPLASHTTRADRPAIDATLQRIRLTSPLRADERTAPEETVILQSSRPLRWYLAPPISAAQRARYTESAVDGSDLRKRATLPCPGLRYAWKVQILKSSSVATVGKSHVKPQVGADTPLSERQPSNISDCEATTDSAKPRCRKSKKTRIKLRMVSRAQQEEVARKQRERSLEATHKKEEQRSGGQRAEEKEQYLAEKKRTMNRKKQIKKREKRRMADGDDHSAEAARPIDPTITVINRTDSMG